MYFQSGRIEKKIEGKISNSFLKICINVHLKALLVELLKIIKESSQWKIKKGKCKVILVNEDPEVSM